MIKLLFSFAFRKKELFYLRRQQHFPEKNIPRARLEEGTVAAGGEMKPYRDLQVFF
jgi:hypothetical protein